MHFTIIEPCKPKRASVNTDRQPLVFLHIPKAGGTTFDLFLRGAALATGRRFKRITGPLYHAAFSAGLRSTLADLSEMPNGSLAGIDIVSGHLPYGIARELGAEPLYCTVLRDPVSRTLSHYRMGIRRGIWKAGTRLELLAEDGRLPDNMMTRQLAGLRDTSSTCDTAVRKKAWSNLQEFALTGMQEDLGAVMAELAGIMGWPTLLIEHGQAGPEVGIFEPDEDFLATIKKMNSYDIHLHEQARGLASDSSERVSKVSGPVTGDVLVMAPSLTGNAEQIQRVTEKEFVRLLKHLEISGHIVHRA